MKQNNPQPNNSSPTKIMDNSKNIQNPTQQQQPPMLMQNIGQPLPPANLNPPFNPAMHSQRMEKEDFSAYRVTGIEDTSFISRAQNGEIRYSIFVGCLPPRATKLDLENHFSKFGKIYDLQMSRKSNKTLICFAVFSVGKKKQFTKIINTPQFLYRRAISCRPYFSGWRKDEYLRTIEDRRVFLKNIPKNYSDKQIFDIFRKFGVVERAYGIRDDEGYSLGFGYVNYIDLDDAIKVIKLQDVILPHNMGVIQCYKFDRGLKRRKQGAGMQRYPGQQQQGHYNGNMNNNRGNYLKRSENDRKPSPESTNFGSFQPQNHQNGFPSRGQGFNSSGNNQQNGVMFQPFGQHQTFSSSPNLGQQQHNHFQRMINQNQSTNHQGNSNNNMISMNRMEMIDMIGSFINEFTNAQANGGNPNYPAFTSLTHIQMNTINRGNNNGNGAPNGENVPQTGNGRRLPDGGPRFDSSSVRARNTKTEALEPKVILCIERNHDINKNLRLDLPPFKSPRLLQKLNEAERLLEMMGDETMSEVKTKKRRSKRSRKGGRR